MAADADERARQASLRAAEQLGRVLGKINRNATQYRSPGFRIPELEADPSVDDPTNLWLLADGRLRARTGDGVVRQYAELVPTGTTGPEPPTTPVSTKPKPVDTPAKRYRKEYAANWAHTYCQQHGRESGGNLYFGRWNATHGTRRIMLGFNDQTIRADLAGATIRKVQLHAVTTHARWNRGVEIYWGAHNKDDAPADWSSVRRSVWHGLWPLSGDGAYWRTVPNWFGTELKAGRVRGLTIEQPSGSDTYYGQIDWSTVRLAIDYTK